MTSRLLTALCLALLFLAGPVSAQVMGSYYDTGDERPGVRFGISAGASVYNGPNILYPIAGVDQENVTEVNPAVTGFVAFPLSGDQLYGRLVAGILNIGADDDTIIARQGGNPFLTNEQLLLEGDLVFNLASPTYSNTVPYLFGGFGAIIADPFGTDDVASALDRDRVAYVIPVGIGVDFRVSRALSFFGEASYRFPLNDVGSGESTFASAGFGPCEDDPTKPECQGEPDPCEIDPTKPECKNPPTDPCDVDPTKPECLGNGGDDRFDTKFGSGLFTGGLRLGLGGRAPSTGYIPPVPEREIIVERETVYVDNTPPRPELPEVCDLVELNSIYFDYGTSTLDTRAQRLLDENVELLMDSNSCCVFIDGYTDTSEYDRFGMGLAGRRAQAVYDYYLSQGVAASRLQLRNRGVATPPCDKEDPGVGCSRNRRVESVPMDCERFRFLLENPSYDR